MLMYVGKGGLCKSEYTYLRVERELVVSADWALTTHIPVQNGDCVTTTWSGAKDHKNYH